METLVKDVHLQDLAAVIEAEMAQATVVDACRRFEVDDSIVETVEDSLLEGFRALADADTFDAVLAYLVASEDWGDESIEALEAALVGSPLSIRETDDGEVELIRTVSPVADRSVPKKRDLLEADAPSVIMTQIEAAEANLTAGDYEFAAAEIRRAMDMLLVGGFDEGLEEFGEHGLIELGSEHEHSDATMLYVTYGYCSFLGGDPQQKGFETSRLQAELAVVIGEEALYFILQKMAEAEEQGIELRRWERP